MRQNAQVRARRRGLPADIEAIDAGASSAGRQYAVHHAQAGGFAGPIGSQQSRNFAVARHEGHIAYGIDATESLG
jgi:hypothetical protein